jgi:DNA-directed RNA polymerase specialized sigma24 family protein
MENLLRRLTPVERMVVQLNVRQGFDLFTVSEILNLQMETVACSLGHAAEKLRQWIPKGPSFEAGPAEILELTPCR